MISSLVIDNEAVKRIRGGQPWIPTTQVIGRKPVLPCLVRLMDKRRVFVATAFCSPQSRYFLRMITNRDQVIDKAFWQKRIRCAYEKRSHLKNTTDAYRVVYAESDGIPSVVIDKYRDVWSVQITSAGAALLLPTLVEILQKEFHPVAIVEKNDIAAREREGLPRQEGMLFGEQSTTMIREGDQQFEVNILEGQKTGAYLDYRSLRLKAKEFARGKCLDAFCYEGWLSCHIAGGAREVIAVDRSASALTRAHRNASTNGHHNISFVQADALAYMKACRERFEFVHLDPPAFVGEQRQIPAAMKGYEKLLMAAFQLLNPGGTLMVSSCSHKISQRMLEEVLFKSLDRCSITGEVVFHGVQDKDHPVLSGVPETLYLKAIAVRRA